MRRVLAYAIVFLVMCAILWLFFGLVFTDSDGPSCFDTKPVDECIF